MTRQVKKQYTNSNLHYLTYLVTTYILDNVYIADSSNNCIRKVTVSTGIITTFAGTGIGSYSGDGGSATSATLNSPREIAFDSSGRSTSNISCAYFYLLD